LPPPTGAGDATRGIPSRPPIHEPWEYWGAGEAGLHLRKRAEVVARQQIKTEATVTTEAVSTLPKGSNWGVGFVDSLGPRAKAVFAFYDLLLGVLLPILVGVLFQVIFFIFRHPRYRFLLESQPLEFT